MKNKTKIYTEVVVNMNTGETISEDYYYADTRDVAQCKKFVKGVKKIVKFAWDNTVGGFLTGVGGLPKLANHIFGTDYQQWWGPNNYSGEGMMWGDQPGTTQEWQLAQDKAGQANSIKGDMGSYWADRDIAQSNYQNQLTASRENQANMTDYEREVSQRNAYKGLSQGMDQAKTKQNAYVSNLQGQWENSFSDLAGINADYGQYASDVGFDNTSSSYLDAYRV